MNHDVTITDPSLFISYWYWGISLILLIAFSSYAWLNRYWRGFKKIVLLVMIIAGALAQFATFRNGIGPIYHHFGFTVFNDSYIRLPALFFTIAYLVFLPVFYKKDRSK